MPKGRARRELKLLDMSHHQSGANSRRRLRTCASCRVDRTDDVRGTQETLASDPTRTSNAPRAKRKEASRLKARRIDRSDSRVRKGTQAPPSVRGNAGVPRSLPFRVHLRVRTERAMGTVRVSESNVRRSSPPLHPRGGGNLTTLGQGMGRSSAWETWGGGSSSSSGGFVGKGCRPRRLAA